MTNSEFSDTPDGAPGASPTQDEQRIDEASGQKIGPPGQGDVDQDKLDKSAEDLEKAGGGH
jgi:hypothetical protein